MAKANKLMKNDAGFTGLEAAIVLIAFVVVAAVFSYVMLGAGFFTSQKSNEVVHTGVDMATSSLQTSGAVVAAGSGGDVQNITLTLQLTAGNNPIDLSNTIVSFQDNNQYVADAWDGSNLWSNTTDSWSTTAVNGQNINLIHGTGSNLLENGELVQITIPVTSTDNTAFTSNVQSNDQITLTVIPPQGATLPITVTVPPAVTTSMALY
jgi:archaeal flagellin FlaB